MEHDLPETKPWGQGAGRWFVIRFRDLGTKVFSSIPAIRLIRPPLAGLAFGYSIAVIGVLLTRSLPIGAWAFLVVWVLSSLLWVRAVRTAIQPALPDETRLVHERLRLVLLAWAILGLYLLIGEFLALLAVSAPSDLVIPVVEVTVLSGTVAYLGLFARFTAAAFTTDVDRIVRETRASGGALERSFLASTKGLGDAFTANTDRLLQKLDERGAEQARILVGMTDALNEVAALLKAQRKVTEETRKLGEEALRFQRDAEETRKRLEAERAQSQRLEEAEARRRMMPALGLRLRVSSAGLFWHHVFVDVVNRGMTGHALEVLLFVDGEAPMRLPGGTLGAQQHRAFDFGDVSGFPLRATLRVVCRIADNVARPYVFEATFQYGRTLGFWNQTKSTWVMPPHLVWPDPTPGA